MRKQLNPKHDLNQLARLLTRLPSPSFETFVGARGYWEQIQRLLGTKGDDRGVVVSGPAGIGKTATINYTTRQLIAQGQFDDVAWLIGEKPLAIGSLGGAAQLALTRPVVINKLSRLWQLSQSGELSPAQRQLLVNKHIQENRCLIVVDNLESDADLQELLPLFQQWQGQSKVVVGTQHCQSYEAFTQIEMTGFDPAGTQQFLHTHTTPHHLHQLLHPLNGNPFALKLALTSQPYHTQQTPQQLQTTPHPINTLHDLHWQNLDDPTKQVLVGLINAGETGFNTAHLQEICALPQPTTQTSLEKLQRHALITKQHNHYRLHHLTQRYLVQKLMVLA